MKGLLPTLRNMGGLALLISLATPSHAEDWTQWRGPNHNGIVSAQSLHFPLNTAAIKQVWQFNTGKSYSAVAIQGNHAYTMGESEGKDTLFCINVTTGKPVWKYSYPHAKREFGGDPNPTATTSTPVLFEKRVYALSREGTAFCLDSAKGDFIWKTDLAKETGATAPQWGYAASPLLDGNRVLFNLGHHGVGVDRRTGSVLWKSSGGSSGYATPTAYNVGSQKGVAFFNGDGVVGVDGASGKIFWEHTWKTKFGVNAIDPVFYKDSFFISAFDQSHRVSVANNTPTVVFKSRYLQNTFVNPILIGDYLYGNSKGRLLCMDMRTGESTWDSTGLGNGTVLAVGTNLIILNDKGELVIAEANPTKYVEVSRTKIIEGQCWAHATLANGKLYCHTVDGDLFCVDLAGK